MSLALIIPEKNKLICLQPRQIYLSNSSCLSKKANVRVIHTNHTNPLLDLESVQSKYLKSKGFNIAYEGLILSM